jgi:hypothetical protein
VHVGTALPGVEHERKSGALFGADRPAALELLDFVVRPRSDFAALGPPDPGCRVRTKPADLDGVLDQATSIPRTIATMTPPNGAAFSPACS